jgi:hypothetical protein
VANDQYTRALSINLKGKERCQLCVPSDNNPTQIGKAPGANRT